PALEAYSEGLAISERHQLEGLRWKFLVNIGVVYSRQNNYPKALEFYHRALGALTELGEKGSPQFVSMVLFNIGGVYSAQGEYQKCLEKYRESLVVTERAGNKTLAAAIHANMGEVYGKLGEYEEALSFLQQALADYQDLQERPAIVTTLQSIAEVQFALDHFERSLAFSEQGITLGRELGFKVGTSACLTLAGKAHWKMGDNTKAIANCTEGLSLAREAATLKEQQQACECLYRAYRGAGRNKEALNFHEQMVVLRDSMFNEENTKKITRLEMQYDFDKKEAATRAEQEKKDAIAAEELQRQKLVRNGFIGGFALVALFAGVFLTQRNRIGREKKRSEELLLNILPEEVAEELKEKGEAEARHIDQVTVLFTDFKGFTAMSEALSPKDLVKDLHECFSAFDRICEEHGLEKIKTIGDAYMAAGGLPTPNTTHAMDVIRAAFEMRDFIADGKARKIAAGLPYFE
ncbi:MAG TPA: tetratricopeptide repeat protein, partial [Flavobacteriales bacterium]|nr:tetratricopeptide repeat protein [Flavobacteriales bacterium]